MSAQYYGSSQDLATDYPSVAASITPGTTCCELGVDCESQPFLLTGDANTHGVWTGLVVIQQNTPVYEILLTCEDCALWLSDALGFTLEY